MDGILATPMYPGLSTRDRRILLAILGLSFVLNLIPFWWGLPAAGQAAWAFDEISPWYEGKTSVERHKGRYPPLHYLVLRVAYAPLRALEHAGWLPDDAGRRDRLFRSTGRILSVVMATATVFLVHQLALSVFGLAWVAHFAALFLASSPTLVYYAKTINLEAPYLFWIALSLVFFWRAWTERQALHYWLYALTATLAVCTKDQAYGLYVLPSLLVWIDLARRRQGGSLWRSLGPALFDRRIMGSVIVAAVSFALVHNLIFDWGSFVHHWRVLIGHSSDLYREFEPTLLGHTAMAWLAARHLGFVLGLPALALAVLGSAVAWRQRHAGLILLAFPVSYYLCFVVVVLYHYDRFLLPAALGACGKTAFQCQIHGVERLRRPSGVCWCAIERRSGVRRVALPVPARHGGAVLRGGSRGVVVMRVRWVPSGC